MILIDYSQVALANLLSFKHELKGTDDQIVNLIRHTVLSTIKYYKKKYGKEYGDIVIACDGRKYWRKEIFEYYKANRKKAREASDLNWKLIFDTLSQLRDELVENFPYKVIHMDRAEADDIIAVLAKYTQDHDMIVQGLMEEPQKVLILSSDGDFFQLQKFPNVEQFSPMQKKYIKVTKKELHEKYITHVVKAGDDGIPNILSPDDIFMQEGVRQKRISAERLAEFMEKGKEACRNDSERRNWDRNERLISFDFIPEDVSQPIIEAYLNSKPVKDKMKIMTYLAKHRCKLLLEELEDF